MKTTSLLAAVLAASLAPALHAQAPELVTVGGNATYLQRIAMPPEAVLTLRVEDVSRADNNARVLADASAAQAPEPATATLQNTYWKLMELGGQAVVMLPNQQREVRITLNSQNSRVMGFSGCNGLVGAYVQDGQSLRFKQVAGTLMACEPPIAALENKVLDMLATTRGQRIDGQQLSLLNGSQVLARFEAVYL
jgi:heat shock protein HslJ